MLPRSRRGDRPVDGGGALVHLVSDQQWVVHWLVYLSEAGGAAPVISSTVPFGFPVAGDAPARFDRDALGGDPEARTVVCADSIDEFLVRFFLENEAWLAGHPAAAKRAGSSPPILAYVAALRARAAAGS